MELAISIAAGIVLAAGALATLRWLRGAYARAKAERERRWWLNAIGLSDQ